MTKDSSLLFALIALLIALGSLGPSSYFLHFDTPTQDLIAADLLGACWGTASGKPFISLILAVPFALGGIKPFWEMAILSALSALSLAALFRLAARLTGSKRWAMLTALWFLSLPIILYFTRIHLGYPLAFFIFGLFLYGEARFVWAGVAFGMAYTSHSSFLVPIATWIGWSTLLHAGKGRISSLAKLLAGILMPVLLVETQRFLFHGELLGWNHDVFGDIFRQASGQAGTTWLHIWEILRASNGWLNGVLLLVGVAYPAVRTPRVRLMDVVYLSGWSVVGVYTLRAGLTHTSLMSRLLAGVYPLLVLSSAFTLMRLTARLDMQLSLSVRSAYRLVLMSVVAVVLPVSIITATLDATVASRTAYDRVDQAFNGAAKAGLPVRYFGNMWAGLFFGSLHKVEVVTNDPSPDFIAQGARPILIFESPPGDVPLMLAAMRADNRIGDVQYEVTTYPHLASYRPRDAEGYYPTEVLQSIRGRPFARTYNDAGQLEIWWPREAGEAPSALGKVTPTEYVVHYPGNGCVASKHYGYGTKNYYDLLIEKARELWISLTAGT